MTAQTKREQVRLRMVGYQDGMRDKPPASTDPVYRQAYRRGQERAVELKLREDR